MRKHFTLFILILLTNLVAAEVYKTINVSTAGTLSTLLTTIEKSIVTNLTVAGNIDARDMKCISFDFSNLSFVDIRNTNIQTYTGTEGPFYLLDITYPNNEFPELSFFCKYIKRPNIKSILLPLSITTIGGSSIQYTGITRIIIPANVVMIKKQAFYYCEDLKTIISLNTTPPVLEINNVGNIFQGSPISTVYVPIGYVSAYKSATGWSAFSNILEYTLSVVTRPVTVVTLSSAALNANIDLITSTPVTSHGFCWNITGSPILTDSKVDNGSKASEGDFSNIILNLSAATTYHVRAYATDGERTVYGSEVSFTTASMPVAAGTISGAQTVCQGQSSVTYTVPAIANATSYIWTLPTGIVGASSANSITLKYERYFTTGSITVKGHNEWGDGIPSTLNITANVLPVNAGAITGNKTVCQGENLVTYIVPAIDNATSYTWVLPTGATGSSTTNSIIVNYTKSAVSGNIIVKGHNDCGDGIVSYSMVTVNQLPVIELRDTVVISGGSVPLFPRILYSGNGTLKYQWVPSTGLSNDTIANPFATVTSRSTYTVVVTTPNGCSASANVTVNILSMAQPEIGIVGVSSSNKNRIVWNKPVTTGIASYYVYKETNTSNVFEKIGTVAYDSLSVFVDNQSSPDVKSNKYKLSIFDLNGMESPLSDAHKTMHLSINKGQNNKWNLIWEAYEGFYVSTYNIYKGTSAGTMNFLDATSGSSTQYSDISGSTGDVYYQLEVISPNLVSPTKAPRALQKSKESGNAPSTSLVSYSSSRSNIATNVISGINDLESEGTKISIYPNPVKDELRIDFVGGSTFEILNLMGQVVYNGNLNKSTVVRTSNFLGGVYLIKFKSGKTFEYKKIIKE